nr:MAG TPA: hypothetical protein [Caudoviricetes sp.]
MFFGFTPSFRVFTPCPPQFYLSLDGKHKIFYYADVVTQYIVSQKGDDICNTIVLHKKRHYSFNSGNGCFLPRGSYTSNNSQKNNMYRK